MNNGSCPHLGRCDDPDNFFAFPTIENCCHSALRPFPVEPPYQADNCLGEDWSECPRYKESLAKDKDSSLKKTLFSYAYKAVNDFPIAWEFVVVAVVVLGVLIGVWLLVLHPKIVTQADMPTPDVLGTATAHAPTETPTQTRTPTASPTRTPSRTPTPSATLTPTQTPTPTPTWTPTMTPSTTPSATPSLTPSLTPIPTTAVPTPTATPTVTGTPLPIPKLSSPEDGQRFSESDQIVLRWQPVGTLPRDGYYVVTASFTHLGDTWYDEIPWIQETSWTFSDHDYLVDLSDDGRFFWSVQVMLRTGLDDEGKPTGIPISPSSATWSLTWQRSEGTPTPPPP